MFTVLKYNIIKMPCVLWCGWPCCMVRMQLLLLKKGRDNENHENQGREKKPPKKRICWSIGSTRSADKSSQVRSSPVQLGGVRRLPQPGLQQTVCETTVKLTSQRSPLAATGGIPAGPVPRTATCLHGFPARPPELAPATSPPRGHRVRLPSPASGSSPHRGHASTREDKMLLHQHTPCA